MENRLFTELGKNFYVWYRSEKVRFLFDDKDKGLGGEIERIAGLIDYVKEKDGVASKSSG